MSADILTRREFEKALSDRIDASIRDQMNRATRQLERWDEFHASSCQCPAGEPHGVRLRDGDWYHERQQELDDAESYDLFEEIATSRLLSCFRTPS